MSQLFYTSHSSLQPIQRVTVGRHLQTEIGLGGSFVDSILKKIKSVVSAQNKLQKI